MQQGLNNFLFIRQASHRQEHKYLYRVLFISFYSSTLAQGVPHAQCAQIIALVTAPAAFVELKKQQLCPTPQVLNVFSHLYFLLLTFAA